MPVKICIYGAGGVGSYLAVMFAQSGLCEVSVIARGKNLDAICRDGLALESEAGCFRIHSANCVANARELPQQDFVFVTVKAHDLPAIAHEIDSLVAPGGAAIFANNGIPWWWNHGLERGDGPLPTVDPDGRLWKLLGPEKAIGCVLYSANELISPGKVRHLGNNRWLVGEPTGVRSRRILTLTELMQGAGLHADIAEDLRLAIWTKLLRNAPFNSLCALTRLTADQFRSVPELSQLAQGMIDEVVAIAASKGWTLPALTAAEIVQSGGLIGSTAPNDKALPSMLQDALKGRPMEVEAILGQICEFAVQENVEVPIARTVLTVLRGLNASLGLVIPVAAKVTVPVR